MAEGAGVNRHSGGHRTARAAAGAGSRAAASVWLSLPWIAILALTAAFHFYRGVPSDGWIFLALAVLLGLDLLRKSGARSPEWLPAARSLRVRDSPGRLRTWLAGGILAALTVLVWAVLLLAPAASIGVPAVVGMVGLAMLLFAWPDPPPLRAAVRGNGPKPRASRAAYWWSGVVLLLCVVELGTYFIDRFVPANEGEYPPLTDLLAPLFADGASRWLMTALWLLACAALLRVARRP
ncbi:MAG: hypothetical protein WBX27_09455 [Specibacter sp.]